MRRKNLPLLSLNVLLLLMPLLCRCYSLNHPASSASPQNESQSGSASVTWRDGTTRGILVLKSGPPIAPGFVFVHYVRTRRAGSPRVLGKASGLLPARCVEWAGPDELRLRASEADALKLRPTDGPGGAIDLTWKREAPWATGGNSTEARAEGKVLSAAVKTVRSAYMQRG